MTFYFVDFDLFRVFFFCLSHLGVSLLYRLYVSDDSMFLLYEVHGLCRFTRKKISIGNEFSNVYNGEGAVALVSILIRYRILTALEQLE